VIAYLADRVVQVGSDGREIVSVDENGYIFPVCESYTIVYDESGAHLFSADGKKLLSGYKELDHLYEENGRNYFLFTDAASEMQVGVLDEKGNVLLECRYDHISVPEKGYFAAENDKGAVLFDTAGNIIWKYEY